MTAPDDETPGRALIEAGRPVAGSMTRGAGTVVYAPGEAAVRLDERLRTLLRAVAAEAAAIPLPRERVRAGAVLAFAVEHAAHLARSGRPVREDGFFAGRPGRRCAAEEVGEAVVQAARRATDERRVRHLGYLLAEVTASPDIDAELATRALRWSEELTWRQLVVLAAVGRRDRVPLPMAPLPDDPRPWTAWAAREDVAGLQHAGLLDPPPAATRPGAVLPRLRATDLRLTRRGVLAHRLLALDFVREEAVAAVLAELGLPRS